MVHKVLYYSGMIRLKNFTSLFSADKGMAINEKIKVEEAQVKLSLKIVNLFLFM